MAMQKFSRLLQNTHISLFSLSSFTPIGNFFERRLFLGEILQKNVLQLGLLY